MQRNDDVDLKKILDIPKIPFDEPRYQKALNSEGVRFQSEESGTYITLARLHAPNNQPGSGYGIAKFRELVSRSIELGCPGKIVTEASTSYGSPHLFYLYMGMAPVPQGDQSYVKWQYGMSGQIAVDSFCSYREEWTNDTLAIKKRMVESLKDILRSERQIPEPTLDDIIREKDFILGLRKKKLEYVKGIFIPTILKILAEDPLNKYPDTNELGKVQMQLTPQGFARWEYCIKNNLEFVPFKDFAHLNLTTEQQKNLNDILNQRATAPVSKKTIIETPEEQKITEEKSSTPITTEKSQTYQTNLENTDKSQEGKKMPSAEEQKNREERLSMYKEQVNQALNKAKDKIWEAAKKKLEENPKYFASFSDMSEEQLKECVWEEAQNKHSFSSELIAQLEILGFNIKEYQRINNKICEIRRLVNEYKVHLENEEKDISKKSHPGDTGLHNKLSVIKNIDTLLKSSQDALEKFNQLSQYITDNKDSLNQLKIRRGDNKFWKIIDTVKKILGFSEKSTVGVKGAKVAQRLFTLQVAGKKDEAQQIEKSETNKAKPA